MGLVVGLLPSKRVSFCPREGPSPQTVATVPSSQHRGLTGERPSGNSACILTSPSARPITFTYGKSPRQGDIGTTKA